MRLKSKTMSRIFGNMLRQSFSFENVFLDMLLKYGILPLNHPFSFLQSVAIVEVFFRINSNGPVRFC